MGVLDSLAHGHEQLQPVPDREVLPIAVLRELDSVHQLHHEIRAAGLGRPGVQHLRDVRVIHHGEGLTLRFKPRHDLLGVHAGLDDLERHPAADGRGLFGVVDDTHPALAQHLEDLERAYALRMVRSRDG